jgi:hypothetical protein
MKNLSTEIARLPERKFGIVIGIALCILAGIIKLVFGEFYLGLVYAGGSFFLLGIIFPILLLPINVIWHAFGKSVFKLTNFILLLLVFHLLLTPIGLIMRILGRDPLLLNPKTYSNWVTIKRKATAETLKDLF